MLASSVFMASKGLFSCHSTLLFALLMIHWNVYTGDTKNTQKIPVLKSNPWWLKKKSVWAFLAFFFSQAWKFIPVTKKNYYNKKEITREIICKKSNVTLFVCMSNRKMNDELWVGSVTKILDKKIIITPQLPILQ